MHWDVRAQAGARGHGLALTSVTPSRECPRSPWEPGDLKLPRFPVCEMGTSDSSTSANAGRGPSCPRPVPRTPGRRPHWPGHLPSFLLLLDPRSHPGRWERDRGPALPERFRYHMPPGLPPTAPGGAGCRATVSVGASAWQQEKHGRCSREDVLHCVLSIGSTSHILDQQTPVSPQGPPGSGGHASPP